MNRPDNSTRNQFRSKYGFLNTSALTRLLGMAGTLALLMSATAAQAQQREIINPSFEDVSLIPAGNLNDLNEITDEANIPGWQSTNGTIEVWVDPFQNRSAEDGSHLVELNPREPIGLYQEVCLVNGESLSWDFQHAARTSNKAPTNQSILYEVVSLDGNTIHQVLAGNTVTEQGSNNNQSQNDWANVTGSTIYTGPTGVQRLQFRSTNAGAAGNFLDNILIDLVPAVSFDGVNTADYENVNPDRAAAARHRCSEQSAYDYR